MLDYRIVTFLSVCETLSFTRTAQELSITQPAVSQHVAHLEKHMGAKLFERRGKRLSITEAGQAVRTVAETMAHDEHLLKQMLGAAQADQLPLSVGTTLTAGEYLVAEPLARYLSLHPDACMTIVQGDTQELVAQLRAGAIDCAFVEGAFDRTAFESRTLCRQRLIGICAPNSRFAHRNGTWLLEDLLEERLIAREPGSGTRAVLERALFDRNLSVASFSHVVEASSINIIKTLVAQGSGIAFLYEAALHNDVDSGRLSRIDVLDLQAEHDIAFIYLKHSAFADRLDRFFGDIDFLRACRREPSA